MATAFVREALIRRAAEEVWEVFTDWSSAAEWMSGIDSVTADGPAAVGSRLTLGARGRDRSTEIVEVERPQLLAVRSEQGPVTATYRYELVETDGGTVFRLTVDCDVRGPLRLIAPLVRRTLRRTDGDQPQALRAMIEA